MSYTFFRGPIRVPFANMTKSQAEQHFNWFVQEIPVRMDMLRTIVRTDAQFGAWENSHTLESLGQLGAWYANSVTVRSRTSEEIRRIYEDHPIWFRSVPVGEWDLSDETLSFGTDVGVYFCECLRKEYRHLKWACLTWDEKNLYYNRPILRGFAGRDGFEPVHMMSVLAYGIARGDYGPGRLRELYGVWSGMVEKTFQ